jgi:UDP-N-acetylmuramoyl-tripeptide--D-alanyl-D-alanine ligase
MWPISAQELKKEVFLALTLDDSTFHNPFVGCSTDSRSIGPDEIFFAIRGEKHDPHEYISDVLKKPGTLAFVSEEWEGYSHLTFEQKKRVFACKDVLESFRIFAHFFRSRFKGQVIGIGGSNGKTTTKELIYFLLKGKTGAIVTKTEKSQNGFLGIPMTLCQKVHHKKTPVEALVLEIGIDTVDSMDIHVATAKPDIVLLTALGPEHLTGLINWETARNEELKLLHQEARVVWQLEDPFIYEAFHKMGKAGDVVVISSEHFKRRKDEALLEAWKAKGIEKAFIFSADFEKNELSTAVSTTEVSLSDKKERPTKDMGHFGEKESSYLFTLPLIGLHNAQNFMLALATARLLDRSFEEIEKGLEAFTPPQMRSQMITLKKQNLLLNDCYNSSPFSLKAGLHALKRGSFEGKQKFIFLGDMLELGDGSKMWHCQVADEVKELQGVHLYLYGEAMYDCYQALKDCETKYPLEVSWKPLSEEPQSFVTALDDNLQDVVFFVKGSRAMGLERVSQALCEKFAQ